MSEDEQIAIVALATSWKLIERYKTVCQSLLNGSQYVRNDHRTEMKRLIKVTNHGMAILREQGE